MKVTIGSSHDHLDLAISGFGDLIEFFDDLERSWRGRKISLLDQSAASRD